MNYKTPSQIGKGAIASQFAPTPIQFHRHTGQDSPQIDYNSLLNKPVASLKVYGGQVNSDGTAANLPAGWSSSLSGTSDYTITHKLGTTNYVVVGTAGGSGGGIMSWANITSNSFDLVGFFLSSYTALPFSFILILTS